MLNSRRVNLESWGPGWELGSHLGFKAASPKSGLCAGQQTVLA